MLSVGRVYLAQVAGQLVLVALVTLALYHFHRHYRRAYLRHWTRSWVALAVYILTAFASARLARMGLLSPSALAGLGLVSMAAAYLHIVWLLLGTWVPSLGQRRIITAIPGASSDHFRPR